MSIDRKIIHELKNQLTISIGLNEMVQNTIQTTGSNSDFTKIIDRLERALTAQRKMQLIFEEHFKKEGNQTP